MLKTWMSCLCLLGSLLTLIAQTETAEPATAKNWLNGDAETEFATSPPLPYAPVQEADILWEKRVWRVIDTREKINLPFRHPEHSLFDVLMDGLAVGELNAYSPEDDRFQVRIAVEDIWDQLNTSDTVYVTEPNVCWGMNQQIINNQFNPERIKRWWVQEVWYQDTRHSQMQVQIIGIAPMIEIQVSAPETTANHEGPIFWINYREARPWLAQNLVPSSGEDHSRMSWDDLFSMRRFHSYIHKESDMCKRHPRDNSSSTHLLLESRKQDRAIQNREMDMWSY